MRRLVVHGATLTCSAGSAPAQLAVVQPLRAVDGDAKLVATVDDFVPMVNVSAFGLCNAMANPQVASATAAANGVLTPVPCQPVIAAPWTSGEQLMDVDGRQALTDDGQCTCQWSGQITIVDPACDVEVE